VPAIRALMQEVLTARLFAQQPGDFKRIHELQHIDFRI
jgi:hypothetical protein